MSIVINLPAGTAPVRQNDSFEPGRHVNEFVIARIVEPVAEAETRYGARSRVVLDLIALDGTKVESVEYRKVIWWGAIVNSFKGYEAGQIVAGRIERRSSNERSFYALAAPTAGEIELAVMAVQAVWGE